MSLKLKLLFLIIFISIPHISVSFALFKNAKQYIKQYFTQNNSNGNKKCRALVLEGGGDKGAYEAGVIRALIESLDPEEVKYDVVSGVSIGSINGLFVSLYDIGNEKQLAQDIVEEWSNLKKENIYKHWGTFFSTLEAFYNKPSVYDNSPSKDYLEQIIGNKTVKRLFTIGISDMTNVKKITKYGDLLSKDELIQAIIESTSMPFIFPYVNDNNQRILADGGVLLNLDIGSAISRCMEIVDDESDIIIDTIMPTGSQIEQMAAKNDYSGYDMLKRYIQITLYINTLGDYLQAKYNHPTVEFRHTFWPLKNLNDWLDGYLPINFDNKEIKAMLQQGYEEGLEIIKNPNLINPNGINGAQLKLQKVKPNI